MIGDPDVSGWDIAGCAADSAGTIVGVVVVVRNGRGTVKSLDELATNTVRTSAANLGRSYGRAGTVVENPGIAIKGLQGSSQPGHATHQIITRGVSPQSLLGTVREPTVVLQQAGNRYLYLADDAAVVMTGDGQVVTAWTSNEFLPHVRQILADAGGG